MSWVLGLGSWVLVLRWGTEMGNWGRNQLPGKRQQTAAESESESESETETETGVARGSVAFALLATTAAVWNFVEPVYVCGLPVAAVAVTAFVPVVVGVWVTGSENTKYLHSTRLCAILG